MKNYQFISLIILILVGIGSTHYILSTIPEKISQNILAIEYDKVGGQENYKKITDITREQTIAGLKQYEARVGQLDSDQVGQVDSISTGGKLSQEKIEKIKKEAYILGNPNAEVTWVEYSDLECPFCKKLHNSGTIEEVMDLYDGKVNFIFKQFPLNFHVNAPKEAEAVLCAGEVGGSEKYYQYISTIFERTKGNGRGFALDALVPLAKELGLDEDAFKTCLEGGKYSDRVKAEMAEGQDFGITGTPGNVLINNTTGKWDKLPGAYPTSSFKQKIDALLQ